MKALIKIAKFACMTVFAGLTCLPAFADVIALQSTRQTGNQDWQGSLGTDFTVKGTSILVTQLGAYDSGADGFVGSIQVGIFRIDTGALVGTVETLTTGNTTLVGFDRFFDVADFVLTPGDYSVVAKGFSGSDLNGNTKSDTVGGPTENGSDLITFIGKSRFDYQPTAFGRPTTIDGGPENRYDAGSFQFVAVPEPGSVALLGLGLLGFVASRRKSAKNTNA
jgi:hypothetical protein